MLSLIIEKSKKVGIVKLERKSGTPEAGSAKEQVA